MKMRDPKSIIIIFLYVVMNAGILVSSFTLNTKDDSSADVAKSMAPEYTEIFQLEYFNLKDGLPLMSLSAESMRSQGEEVAEFVSPIGVYNYQQKNKIIKYDAHEGIYRKNKNILVLNGSVKVSSDEATYLADKLKYYFQKDLIVGRGHVKFMGDDPKTKDHLTINSESMRAQPQKQLSKFKGSVHGEMVRKRQYEGRMLFSSNEMDLKGTESLAQLVGNVEIKRQQSIITGGKADIYLENFNKSLKYFVINDDVKMRDKVTSPDGVVTERKAFAERMEGFGREQKMVLSGAPRVETGQDVIKGYRITVRDNAELIEVDDAMSDVQVKQKKLKE